MFGSIGKLVSKAVGGVSKFLGSPLGSTAVDIGSSALGGYLSNQGAQAQNQANREITKDQMDFQERMSNTAYQRSMKDMREAGLNPMLAYKQGGASSPSGAGIPAIDEVTPALSTALQTARVRQDLKNLREVNKQTISSTRLNEALERKAYADADVSNATARGKDLANTLIASQLPQAKTKEGIADSKYGKVMSYIERFTESIGGLFQGSKPLRIDLSK